MKPSANKAIIYDGSCPLCSSYTKAFVRYGFLEENGRIAFSELGQQAFIKEMDLHRSRHEIPLVDLSNGKTIYGLDALILILGQKLAFLPVMMRIKPLYWFFKRLYALVSYNRRIIIPAEKKEQRFDCSPDLNIKYRLSFIVFAILFSGLITALFGSSLPHYTGMPGGAGNMLLIAGTGWALQLLLSFVFMGREKLDYAGHLCVIMILGVLLLLPSVLLSALTGYQYVALPAGCIVLSSSLMLQQHIRRVRLLGLSQAWTVSWFSALQITAITWIYFLYL